MGVLDLKYKTFGLDINDLSLKIIKLKKQHRGFALASFNEAEIAPGIIEDGVIKKEAALIKVIKLACDTIKGEKIKTKYVVASLPEEKSFLQVIQMPKMTEEELKVAVPFEAENYIPLPLDEVYLDYQIIPTVKDYLNYLEVLIVATPKKIVDSYVSCLKKADLTPIALEVESDAIARALVKKEINSPLLVLIDFGENNTNFIIFSGRSTRFTCSIPISSALLTKAIAESLKISFHEAEKMKIEYGLTGKKNSFKAEKVLRAVGPILEDLTAQIKKYLNFYREHSSYEYLLAEKKIDKILFCGGGSELKGLAEFMSRSLDIPVEMGNPLTNFLQKKSLPTGRQAKNIVKKDLISYTTAIGLALRQTDDNNL